MARGLSCVLASLACASFGGVLPVFGDAPENGLRLGIVVCDTAGVPARTLTAARLACSRVFAKTRISVEWLDCTRAQVRDVRDVERGIACHRPRLPHQVVLEILPHPVSAQPPTRDIGGFARLAGNGRVTDCAGVFYARAVDLAQLGDASASQILAHLIAHEVGHVLLGAGSHSSDGIMRAAWSRADMARAAWGQLTFDPEQAERLRVGFRDRTARGASSGGLEPEPATPGNAGTR